MIPLHVLVSTRRSPTQVRYPGVPVLKSEKPSIEKRSLTFTTAATPTAEGEPAKWQTVFWALVPLVLGNMMQPVGRVMEQPPNLRFWMRSSPLLCLLDMVYFFARVLFDCFYPNQHRIQGSWWSTFWHHFRAEVAYRFRDEADFRLLEQHRRHKKQPHFKHPFASLIGRSPIQAMSSADGEQALAEPGHWTEQESRLLNNLPLKRPPLVDGLYSPYPERTASLSS